MDEMTASRPTEGDGGFAELCATLLDVLGSREAAERWIRSAGRCNYQREADAINEWKLRRSRG